MSIFNFIYNCKFIIGHITLATMFPDFSSIIMMSMVITEFIFNNKFMDSISNKESYGNDLFIDPIDELYENQLYIDDVFYNES